MNADDYHLHQLQCITVCNKSSSRGSTRWLCKLGVHILAAITAGLAAPAHKKQHTEHVQIASTNPVTLSAQDKQSGVPGTAAEMSVQCPAPVQASQDATSHAAQASDPQPREAAAAPNTASNPADEAQGLVAHPSASAQQAACSEGQMPDNNTILWEPLVVKVNNDACQSCLLPN